MDYTFHLVVKSIPEEKESLGQYVCMTKLTGDYENLPIKKFPEEWRSFKSVESALDSARQRIINFLMGLEFNKEVG